MGLAQLPACLSYLANLLAEAEARADAAPVGVSADERDAAVRKYRRDRAIDEYVRDKIYAAPPSQLDRWAAEARKNVLALVHQLRGFFIGESAREVIDLIACCSVAMEPLVLIGPPGSGKTEMATTWFEGLDLRRGVGYFEILMTRFTTPEEVVGPISITELQKGRYRRLTEGFLPKSYACFLDELFAAGPAILNTLLSILHNGVFHNGGVPEPTDLLIPIAASNQLPAERELLPFLDRFAFRAEAQYLWEEADMRRALHRSWVRDAARSGAGEAVQMGQVASLHDLRVLNRRISLSGVAGIRTWEDLERQEEEFVNDAGVGGLTRAMKAFLEQRSLRGNVRRCVKAYKVMRARAALERGDFDGTSPRDLRVIEFMWDDDPRNRRPIQDYLNAHDVPDLLELPESG